MGVRLHPGNDRSWLNPYIATLTRPNAAIELPAASPDYYETSSELPPESITDSQPDEAIDASITLRQLLDAIEKVERFRVVISHRDGRKVRGDLNKGFQPYPY